ncbi:hypothetical protein [Methylobacterium gnaphalii]|uniref:Uncharacterized protein n=1 Tax=Methylobacterium gnaphalii TaxID=1010610 RepID=A0A512JK97_9HYPH|nr:hypothetical protein [Methylobacterium gnaphalii]GEP10360.1 hypothetical protein MGN01_22050 [Methylobacterium gnaphalii]GJD68519.1 hypothetical protein MMMDOFMJ_1442 [Methylobacterium gnaphalii]GLS51288.1 hypothetical protein GCM10007885_41430 [Methylobacterium gnaphalii]
MRVFRLNPDPLFVLATAIVLPGMGHVLTGRANRGLGFAAFTVVGAWLTTHFAAPDASMIGRHAAGLFVWALSIPDAYRGAKLRSTQAA